MTDLDLAPLSEPEQWHCGSPMSPNWIQAAGIGSFLVAISAVFITGMVVTG